MNKESEEFFQALRAGDRRAAYVLVDRVIDRGAGLAALYLQIIQPAMYHVGQLWQRNALTVADEHLATAVAQAAMARAFDRAYRWHDSRTPALLAACADEERHQIGLRMLCDILELDGWETTYLGASVPIESLAAMVANRRPDVVAISVTLVPYLPHVRAATAAIRERGMQPNPVIIVGGRAINGDTRIATTLGADLTAVDAVDAQRLLQERFAERRNRRA